VATDFLAAVITLESPQTQTVSSFVYLVVAGRVKDLSLKGLSLLPIFAGMREDWHLSSKAREYVGIVFTFIGIFPADFAVKATKKPQKKTQFFFVFVFV
jgi:hypothetical protein